MIQNDSAALVCTGRWNVLRFGTPPGLQCAGSGASGGAAKCGGGVTCRGAWTRATLDRF
jgi:hypothetical protein